ncbi:hypothetical protein BCR33DRAFT_415705 [Rhizoclosmatium globosum]|uniref:Uncharacterized protein n=1 Tax=Rhizoclosmatium globosum TaxID=329046 RepID=A0A1Y2BY52_9FUNG|nr:hypothetical protein BCR33DRAFT_415705 [Rhizoclosmatium globosum]|eukprot:ORY38995.1 hypothetical protein BCR33DRAFT_415705 [Rhizoclosmatium globosum]
MTTELALGRIPLAPAFFIPLMCGPLLYIPLVFVFHHFTGRWPYEFLDISKPYAWAYYVLIVGLVAVVFIIVWKVLRMRDQRRDKLGLQPIIPEKKSLPLVNVPAPAATEPVPLAGVSTVDGSSSPATNIPPSATSSASAAPQPVLVPIPSPTPTPNQQQIQQSTGIASTPQTPPGTTQFGGLTDTLPAGNPQGGADGFLRNILGNTEKWLEGQAGVTNPNAVPETPAPAMSPGGPTGNPTKSWEGLGNTALGGVEHFVEGKFFGAGAAKNTATEQSATPSGAGANAGLNGSK